MLEIGRAAGTDNYLAYLDYLVLECRFKDPNLYLEIAETNLTGIYALFPTHPA